MYLSLKHVCSRDSATVITAVLAVSVALCEGDGQMWEEMRLHSTCAVVAILMATLFPIRALGARRVYRLVGRTVPSTRHLALR